MEVSIEVDNMALAKKFKDEAHKIGIDCILVLIVL